MGDGEPRVPTAIAVTSADMALPPQDERTVPAVVLQDVEQRPLDQVLAELQTLVDHHGHVIVVCSQAVPPAVERRLRTVRSLLESDRIALFRPDLPPLGLSVLVRQLRQLASCDLSPGVLASAGRLLTHYIHSGALLGSVARLDRVPVGLKAHAKSWVPGSQFAVLAHPQPQLVRIGTDAALGGPDFGTWMLVARGQQPADWVTGTLAPSWNVLGMRETPLPADSAAWWGTGRVTEFCAFLPDLSVLYQLVTSVRQSTCHWCGIDVIGDRCVFCSAGPPAEELRHRGARRALPPATEQNGRTGVRDGTRGRQGGRHSGPYELEQAPAAPDVPRRNALPAGPGG
ncbi:hypothetical protein [Streptomyces sp. CRN 30]|uniref:hypothetical protein n=1 Tax=Streptomyces sp. CRN 30 TaxID=3075613 RepID=UPI002A8239C0|nr:hypothetical protein [Streptomyces sp. CRN 30]